VIEKKEKATTDQSTLQKSLENGFGPVKFAHGTMGSKARLGFHALPGQAGTGERWICEKHPK
jgi:hypothetical protein